MSGSAIQCTDGLWRCRWSASLVEFFEYHDREWGFPVGSDDGLFEKLCLESFQSGLSWRTILAKRENFRRAFVGFSIEHVARFGPREVEGLLGDEGIVRHRGKIEAVINNAQRARELVSAEGSLAAFVWSFEPTSKSPAHAQTASTSPEATALAKALKKRGWKFVGPTTVFAFMQAIGLVNDHVDGCGQRAAVDEARANFRRPLRSTR